MPPSSIQIRLPPPAPMVAMSSTGVRTGSPSSTVSGEMPGRPSVTRQTSVEVPPMSKVMRWPAPEREAAA